MRDPIWSKVFDVLSPPERLSVSEWAERYRVLSPQWSRFHGRWKNSTTPWLVGVMNAFSTATVRRVSICKAAQAAGTEALMNMLGFAVWGDPGPAMWVYPAHADAKRLLDRIRHLSSATPVIGERRAKDRYDQSLLGCKFRNMSLWFASAKTPRSLAQVPCRYVFLDEVDKYDRWSGDESDPVSLASQRTQTFTGIEKVVEDSTPTTEDGYISRGLDASHRLKFVVPCPECGTFQELVWSRVRWNDGDPTTARYLCIECESPWEDEERWKAVERGLWVPFHDEPTKTPTPDPMREPHLGFQWSRLYSKIHRLAPLAKEFLEAKNYPEKLMSFVNNVLAEPFAETIDNVDPIAIKTRNADDYIRGQVPRDVQVLTAGIDVHDDNFRWVVRGWGKLSTSWLVDYGWIMYHGEPDFDELERTIFSARVKVDGSPIMPSLALIDASYKPATVYPFARANASRIRAVKTDGQIPQPWVPRSHKNHGIILWHVRTSYYKDLIFGRFTRDPLEDGAIHFPVDTGDDYFDELFAQRKERVTNRRTGRVRYEWTLKRGVRNDHFLDCEVLNFAAGDMLDTTSLGSVDAPGRLAPAEVRQLEETIERIEGDDWIEDARGDWLEW